jgi:ABC-type lipoprotein export system ATPase subunit
VAIARALVSTAAVSAGEPADNRDSRSSAEGLGLLRRCVTGFWQTTVMVTHDPVAAAFSRPDSRWPAGSGGVPRRSSRVSARLPGTPAADSGYGDIT